MPVMMLMEWTGVTAAQYDEICRQVNWEGDRPPGGLFHIAAATSTGLRITDLWESAEHFNKFVETRLMPGVQRVGVQGQPRVEILPTHAVFAPGYQGG